MRALSSALVSLAAVFGAASAGGAQTVVPFGKARSKDVGGAMANGGWNLWSDGSIGEWFQPDRARKIEIVVRAAMADAGVSVLIYQAGEVGKRARAEIVHLGGAIGLHHQHAVERADVGAAGSVYADALGTRGGHAGQRFHLDAGFLYRLYQLVELKVRR